MYNADNETRIFSLKCGGKRKKDSRTVFRMTARYTSNDHCSNIDFAYPILMSFHVFPLSLFLDPDDGRDVSLHGARRSLAVRDSTELLASNAHEYVFDGISGEVRREKERRKGRDRGNTPARRAVQSHLIRVHPVNAASHRGR